MIKRILLLMAVGLFVSTISAAGKINIPSDETISGCDTPVEIQEITKAVIHMTPFRGVNLIFPFKLNSDTMYTLSSASIWEYKKVQGQNVVPVWFKSFKKEWGEIHDMTITHNGITFSLSLVADPRMNKHCTNIVFHLSEEVRLAMEKKDKKNYLDGLKEEYEAKYSHLDQQAEIQALELVGGLVSSSPSKSRVNEESTTELKNGDQTTLYVKSIVSYGKFNTLHFEIENDSDINPLYIQAIEVFRKSDKKNSIMEGHVSFDKKMNPGQDQDITFTTLSEVPITGAELVVKTDQGDFKVAW